MDRNRSVSSHYIFAWKRAWRALLTIVVAVPGGMLLNELLRLAGIGIVLLPTVGSSTGPATAWPADIPIGATSLYSQLRLFTLPLIKARSGKG